MICDSCRIERLDNDFINSVNICYKCVYRQKLENIRQKRTVKIQYCRNCGTLIEHKKNEKKRQRTVFCSIECAQKGHKKQLNNHWTRKVSSNVCCPKKGENKWTSNQV